MKPPQQLDRRDPQVPFREVDAGTDAAAGAVAEVVALVSLLGGGGGGGVDGREGGEVGVARGVEVGGVLPAGGVVVEGPDVEDDGGVFGEAHAVDVVIWCVRFIFLVIHSFGEFGKAGLHAWVGMAGRGEAYLRISRARPRGEARGAICGPP